MAGLRIRVAIVEDHPIVMDGLEAALGATDDLKIVARAETMAEASTILGRADVDVAVLDIRLSDGNTLQLLSTDARLGRPAVLVLSSFDAPQYVGAAVRLGAQGFLLKTAPVEEILDAIRQIARGGTVFSAEALRTGRMGFVAMSSREREILRLLLKGRSNREIAHEIGAASKTVEAHLARMFARYGVSTRTDLALAAERGKWLDVIPPN